MSGLKVNLGKSELVAMGAIHNMDLGGCLRLRARVSPNENCSEFPHFLMTLSVCSWIIRWMSRYKATSPSEHRDSSTEASEHRDSITEASKLSSTKRNFSVHVNSKWVSVSLASALLLPAFDDAEEIR